MVGKRIFKDTDPLTQKTMETVEDDACVLAEHDDVLKAQARLPLLALNVRFGSLADIVRCVDLCPL